MEQLLTEPVLLWFRQDLRLTDQPALAAAAAAGSVIPIYVLDDETPRTRYRIGAAQRWWLHGSLERLAGDLEAVGSRLILRRGRADTVLEQLLDETGAIHIHALRHTEPWWREAEAALGSRLVLHDGNDLTPLGSVVTGSGQPFRVYAAFWGALQAHMPPQKPLKAPSRLTPPDRWPHSETLESWALVPSKPNWATGFDMMAGETEAAQQLRDFADRVGGYEAERDLPAEEGTSRLSPYLHFGEVSPAMVWRRGACGVA
jgi:deoxyribodipyrimidine photo-lyase